MKTAPVYSPGLILDYLYSQIAQKCFKAVRVWRHAMECTIVVRHSTCSENQTPSLAALSSLPTDKVSELSHLHSTVPLMASIYRVFMIISCNMCTI